MNKRDITIFLITLLAILLSLKGLAQTALPKDYYNKNIQNKQRLTATYFWTFLELNMPDSALNYVDSFYLAKNPKLKDKIKNASKTINPIYKSCLPRGNTITYSDTTNIISTYYTIPPRPKFAMWLSFKQGDEGSKIILIEFKNEQQLAADRKKGESKNSDMPPQSAPPRVR